MKILFGKKWVVLVILSLNVLLIGLFCLLQVAGIDPLAGIMWSAYPLGPGTQINLLWDVFRLSLNSFEPAAMLLKEAKLWDTTLWVNHLFAPEISAPHNSSYDARLYGIYSA